MQSYHSACELHKNRDFSIDTNWPVSSVGRMSWGAESPVSLSLRIPARRGGKIRRMTMARGSCLAAAIKAGILGLAVLGEMAMPAHAGDPPKLALSGSAWLTTDY